MHPIPDVFSFSLLFLVINTCMGASVVIPGVKHTTTLQLPATISTILSSGPVTVTFSDEEFANSIISYDLSVLSSQKAASSSSSAASSTSSQRLTTVYSKSGIIFNPSSSVDIDFQNAEYIIYGIMMNFGKKTSSTVITTTSSSSSNNTNGDSSNDTSKILTSYYNLSPSFKNTLYQNELSIIVLLSVITISSFLSCL